MIDPLEQEADRVAAEVTRGLDAPAHAAGSSAPPDRLPAALRLGLEARLGHDLSSIRIHADSHAAGEAERFGALAFTKGQDISFGRGQYAPHTAEGRRLLAHELTHVVQQGAAPRTRLAAPIAATAGAPSIQLDKPKKQFLGGKWEPNKVKALIKEKDKGGEIWKAIEKNDLTGTPSLFRSKPEADRTHEWWLEIAGAFLDRASLNPGTKKGETRPTRHSSETRKDNTQYEVHTIPIDVNWILDASPEDEQMFPPNKRDQERVNFMAARTLYHELIHALLRIDEESGETSTQATQSFAKRTAKINASPKLQAAEESIRKATSLMVSAAEQAIGGGDLFAKGSGTTLPTRAEIVHQGAVDDQLDAKLVEKLDKTVQDTIPFANKSPEHVEFIDQTVRMFLEEKHARQAAGEAFGQKKYQDNSQLVDDYADQVESTIEALARRKVGRPGINLRDENIEENQRFLKCASNLKVAVTRYYSLLDTEPEAGATPLGVRYFDSPEWSRPLETTGQPVKQP